MPDWNLIATWSAIGLSAIIVIIGILRFLNNRPILNISFCRLSEPAAIWCTSWGKSDDIKLLIVCLTNKGGKSITIKDLYFLLTETSQIIKQDYYIDQDDNHYLPVDIAENKYINIKFGEEEFINNVLKRNKTVIFHVISGTGKKYRKKIPKNLFKNSNN